MKIGSIEFSSSWRRFATLTSLLIASAAAAACVSTTPPEGPNDPSSAQAHGAPIAESSPVLEDGHAPIPEAASSGAAAPSGAPQHAAHDHGAHDHASHEHAAHQDHAATAGTGAKQPPQPEDSPKQPPMYVCPMHPDVRQSEPGRCPKCGMPLELEKPKAESEQ